MKERQPRYHWLPKALLYRPTFRCALLAGALLCGSILHPAGAKGDGATPAREAPAEQGFAVAGELRFMEDGLLSVSPWAPRLPARIHVRTSGQTRYLRQRKGQIGDVRTGDLVLVVEQPPNGKERRSRKAQEVALKRGRPRPPARLARARALLRCWKVASQSVTAEDRQAAKALLSGALPFFRGPSRGSVKPPDDETSLSIGTVASLRPFTVRTAKGTVRYQVGPGTLVVNHIKESMGDLKRGQSVLVHTQAETSVDELPAATVVAISPRPRLRPTRERRLIIRERKQGQAGG